MKRIALIGNPNSGKTTLFNFLTGMHQKIGNFPGVTVDIKSGFCRFDNTVEIVDLPGIYSLEAEAGEEKLTRDFLDSENVDLIVNVADATILERSLILAVELRKRSVPVVVALNFCDEIEDVPDERLAVFLKCPVQKISAAKGLYIRELVEKISACENQEPLARSIEADRFFTRRKERSLLERTKKLDHLFLHRFFGAMLMLLMFAFVLFASVFVGGMILSPIINHFLEDGLEWLRGIMTEIGIHEAIRSFFCDGVLLGLATVFSIFPTILILFFFISLLEDSGYFARIAALSDRMFRNLGLSGKSSVPLFLSFGCSVPAVMSARTLSDEEERKKTIALIPYLICPARLMILLSFGAVLFPGAMIVFIFGFYLLSVMVVILCAFLMKKKRNPEPFILELPKYRMPSFRNAFFLIQDKLKDYIDKAFGVILLSSMVIWFLQSFDFRFRYVNGNSEISLLAEVGKTLSFLLEPFHFSEGWKVASSLISGLISKETFLTSMVQLYGSLAAVTESFSFAQIVALLIFVMLYMPCIATFSVVRKELHSGKKAAFLFTVQTVIAYGVSYIFYLAFLRI